jgi:RNA 2',3'-cyclic 3'-phosphodiesterase
MQEHGYFLGTLLGSEALQPFARLGALTRRQYGLTGRLRPLELLHVTLYYFGRFEGPDERVDRLINMTKAACAAMQSPGFEARFDQVMSFGKGDRKKPVVATGGAGVNALVAFQEALGHALELGGVPIRKERFKPHITLLYDRAEVKEHAVEPVAWNVSEFSLIHSNIGESRYDVLATWPLAAPG